MTDDFRSRINRLRTGAPSVEERAEAGRQKCYATLAQMHARMMDLRRQAAELNERHPPTLYDGRISASGDIERDIYWFIHGDDQISPPPHITDGGIAISYNPFTDHWLSYQLDKSEPLTAEQIFNAYSDILAEWVANGYPLVMADRRKKEAGKAARRAREAQITKEQIANFFITITAPVFLVIVFLFWLFS